MHNRIVPSFFLTNKIGAPHKDTLGRMNPLSTNSCNWTFNSFNSIGVILYGGIETRAESGNSFISNYSSLSGGRPGRSSENTSENSHTIGTFSIVTSDEDLLIT